MPEDDILFNQEVALGLFCLNDKVVLHVFDFSIGFNATFLVGRSANNVWIAHSKRRSIVYVSHLNRFCTDSGCEISSTSCHEHTTEHDIGLKFAGAKLHNFLGLGERYHNPSRRIYWKLRLGDADLSHAFRLHLALKNIKVKIGLDGEIPSLLVFGSLPHFFVTNVDLLYKHSRLLALDKARRECVSIVTCLPFPEPSTHASLLHSSEWSSPVLPCLSKETVTKRSLALWPLFLLRRKEVSVRHNSRLFH